jgi:hypothetical protein
MLFNNINFIEIQEGIYLYRNYLNTQELSYIQKLIKERKNIIWPKIKVRDSLGAPNLRLSDDIEEISFIYRRIHRELLANLPHYIEKKFGIIKMEKGDFWGVHADNNSFKDIKEKSKDYIEGEEFTLCRYPEYSMVIYLNDDYKGGEAYFKNKKFAYKPKAGDLLIYSSDEEYNHGVLKIKSGTRYTYSNLIFNEIRVPIS